MKRIFVSLIGAAALTLSFNSGHAQDKKAELSYSNQTTSQSEDTKSSGDIVTRDTSRQKILRWDPMTVPSGNGFAFAQRLSNLAVSIIEQKSGVTGKIDTLYAASGTFVNGSEDDKHNGTITWTIEFKNSAGTIIDSFVFPLPWNHCSYHGEEPFNVAPRPTSFNLIDVIVSARATGYKPGGYEGGC